ncbi:metallophosphoesterase [Kordiimonas lipolytica]|uniref:Metallophosphoesterase n=1 Tax=Kordiimonas lipolytica TaxID=1662421 RepID=A0ABV8UAY6_9PROT|nr:metallophosphoesterase [Kordiimonas lipolytica]
MKIAFGSDLHFEFGGARPSLEAIRDVDLLVLAGDIAKGRGGLHNEPLFIEYAKSYADELHIPVVTVLGNHELYGEEYHAFLKASQSAAAEQDLVHFLENNAVVFDGVRVLGCALWTDFKLGDNEAIARQEAYNTVNDYKRISIRNKGGGTRSLTPAETAGFNEVSRIFLEKELAVPFQGPTVVVTHFPPIFMSDPQYEGDALSPYFCNGWQEKIESGVLSPDVWIAGHTHYSMAVTIGRTRIVSRQGGYPGELEPFEWGVIEI